MLNYTGFATKPYYYENKTAIQKNIKQQEHKIYFEHCKK